MRRISQSSAPFRRTAGFTIVEILVVVSIFTVLLTLLLPAVNNARESSRRTSCTANQTRLAMAMARFNAAQGFLPGYQNNFPLDPGVLVGGLNYRQACWAVMLLPHIERSDISNTMKKNLLWESLNASGSSRQGVLLQEFLCPSSLSASTSQTWSYSSLGYGVNVASPNRQDGALVDNVTTTTRQGLDDISQGDGLTSTFLTSEARFASWPGGWGPAWHVPMLGLTAKALLLGNRFGVVVPVINNPTAPQTLPNSAHPGGAVVSFCDGRTKFLKNEIAPHVWGHISTSRSVLGGTVAVPSYATTAIPAGVNSAAANTWLRSGAPSEPFQIKETDY